jgi:pyroglutamyl-peptidase
LKILLAAFDPFGGEEINPANEAVGRLPETIAGAEVVKLTVPTVFGRSLEVLNAALARELPDIAIGIGQAGGRTAIEVERVAINVDDAGRADNEGNRPVDLPIVADGPDAYFARLTVKAMVAAIRDGGIPAAVSNSAGTFVCNHLMYGLLHAIATRYPAMRGGFIHVPYLPEQVVEKRNAPGMSLDYIVRGLTLAIEAAIKAGSV